MAADATGSPVRVEVVSDGRLELAGATLDAFDLRTERLDVVCASGDRETGTWRGVAVAALLDRAGPAPGATHLVVAGGDGYRVCVPLPAALDALLAVDRLDAPDTDALPRLLGRGVDGTRSVKRVRRLETVALGPGEDPAAYEQRPLDDR